MRRRRRAIGSAQFSPLCVVPAPGTRGRPIVHGSPAHPPTGVSDVISSRLPRLSTIVLLCAFVAVAALPASAAYTKLYKCRNTTGMDQSHFRVINNSLEVITGYYSRPSAWSPPVVGTCTWNGVYCTKLRFGDIGLPWVAPGAYGYVGWRTADNNCRLSDLRWVAPSGATYVVTGATQQQGVPGGGEVRYDAEAGEYVWLIINDTDAPLYLSDVSLQVLDEPPPLDVLQGMVWPQALMRALADQEQPPHPEIVAERIDAVISDDLAPLRQAVADAEDSGYLSPADEADLLGELDEAEAALHAGETAYALDPQQAEADWADAVTPTGRRTIR